MFIISPSAATPSQPSASSMSRGPISAPASSNPGSAGTHDGTASSTLSGSRRPSSSIHRIPSRPSTLAISWLSMRTVVVPCGITASAMGATVTIADSTCRCVSMRPGTRCAPSASSTSVSGPLVWLASPNIAPRPALMATSARSWTSRVWTLTRRPFVISRSAGVRPMQTSERVLVAAESGTGMGVSLCAEVTRSRAGAVADPVPRAGAEDGGAVAGVGEPAPVEREAAAADALGQAAPEAAELSDAVVDARAPGLREPVPVAPRGRAVGRQLGELVRDLIERQADLLGEDDERDAAEHRARVAAVAGSGALRGDEPALLVEAQRRRRHAAALRHLADRHELRHLT